MTENINHVSSRAVEKATVWWRLTVAGGFEHAMGKRIVGQTKGNRTGTRSGITGEIRCVRQGDKIRLTYKPGEGKRETTLQVSLFCPRNTPAKTNLRFHHEKLAGQGERERMNRHWENVLAKIAARMTGSPPSGFRPGR